MRLHAQDPFDAASILDFLGTRAVSGVEHWDGTTFRRSLALQGGHATVACEAIQGGVLADFRLSDDEDLPLAVANVRRLFDLDAQPSSIAATLGADPMLTPVVTARPGLRLPGSVDPTEILVRAIVGQQVSVAGARTLVERLVSANPVPLALVDPYLDRVFPSASVLAQVDPETLAMPRARAQTLVQACAAVAAGSVILDPSADSETTDAALQQLRGIGPWTAAYIRMRGLGDPDVMLSADLGVRRAVAALGGDDRPKEIEARAQAWRPWRSYAVAYLWASLSPAPSKVSK